MDEYNQTQIHIESQHFDLRIFELILYATTLLHLQYFKLNLTFC